ncbi:hypothetical protein, partial [Pseudomonas sp. PDM25]|uniref:hypothetical protein n=1 Tax=Pseudomonas sp. PDM25 TaxID=2854772 RepID=UPI001C46D51B
GGSLCLKYATTYSIGGVQLATPEAVRSGDDNLAAVTPLGLKGAYLPKLNPEVDGAVTITKDQTKYPPADRELVTADWVRQQPAWRNSIFAELNHQSWYSDTADPGFVWRLLAGPEDLQDGDTYVAIYGDAESQLFLPSDFDSMKYLRPGARIYFINQSNNQLFDVMFTGIGTEVISCPHDSNISSKFTIRPGKRANVQWMGGKTFMVNFT